MKSVLMLTPMRLIPIGLICITYGFLTAAIFDGLTIIPYLTMVLMNLWDAAAFVMLTMLLRMALKYSNWQILNLYQRYVNCIALVILLLILWSALSYVFSSLVISHQLMAELFRIFPVKVFIASLLLLILLQHFLFSISQKVVCDADDADDKTFEFNQNEEAVDQSSDNGPEKEKIERIAVRSGAKINVIAVSDVFYFQSDGDYVQIHTADNKYLKEETMKFLQENLISSQFVRVHRSFIVNVEKIMRIELYEKNSQQLTLSNGKKIAISAAGYKRLRETIGL